MDNLVACYVDKLNQCGGETDEDALSTIVLLYDVLNAEHEKKDLNFEILFKDETRGIISYLKTLSTKKEVSNKVINELSNLLNCMVVDFTDVAAKYISSIVEKFLEPTIMHSGITPLKVMAYEVLLLIIRTPGIACLQDEWLDKFFQNLLHLKTEKSTIPSTEKKKVYQLLGEIIVFAPRGKDPKKIFRLLCSQIGKQIHYFKEGSTNFRVNEMEGLYDCLQLFLKQFHNEDCVKNSTVLYSFVKEGCGMEIPHRKTSIRAAFKILQDQFALFANNVFEDYVWWTDLFTRFLKSSNKDDQLAAFHAFNTFYRGISKVLKEKSDQKDVLKYFIDSLQKWMKKSTNNEVALAVQNFGHFAKVCKIYGEKKELKRMFALTSQIAENCCSGQMEDNIELHHMSSLLVSMSKITQNLYDENSYEEEFAIVGKFSAFLVISYPKVPNNFRYLVKNNLIKTFIIFGSISDTVLDSYLEKLMLTSLIKCCSCPLERDIEYLNSLGKTKNSNLTSCNDYLPLWKAICNVEKELTEHKIVSERKKVETIRKKNLPSKVFDIFIKSILSIFEKLDFSVIEDDGNNDEIGIIDNFGLKPKTESDFYIFVNLVELFSAVIGVCELDVFEKWIPELIIVFIKLSATCSIKSGFFQLFTVIFQRGRSQSCYLEILLELKSFIIETVVNLRKLKGVDLSSCLRMVLKIPLIIVETIRPYIASVLQVVFTQGLEDLSLARSGLEALQTWKTYLGAPKLRPILEIIVPLLNLYLESKKSVGDTDTLTKYEERLIMPTVTTKNKIYRKFYNMNVNSSSTDLLKFQGEILAFLSEIDVDLCRTIYNPEKCITNEFTEVLRFDVPFRDRKVKIFLDKFLPRVIKLTFHSNLRTRITACEMLHSMTIVFLGNTIAENKRGELSKPIENLFRQLVTCIFKLGSDDNGVIKVMFAQLSHQLARYYSRDQSNVPALILDILFDSVSHMRDISLRHFSAGVIKEFVCGSLKAREDTHILGVMKFISLFSVQPCAFKRQGAALAFNSICGVIQGRPKLISTYWIELLVNFVKSLSLNNEYEYDDLEASNSLKHIKRVLLENPDVFLQRNAGRRVPKCLQDGTLKSVVVWLLQYCVSENKLCRNSCMDLMVDLCCKLPGVDSLEKFFSNNQSEDNFMHGRIVGSISLDEDFLNCVDIRSHKDEFYLGEFVKRTIKWLRSSLAGLHCLSWLLKEKVTSFESSTSNYWFLSSMKFYCEFILPNDLNGYVTERDSRAKPESIPADLKTVYETVKYEVFNEYLNILITCNIVHFEECIGSEQWHVFFWRCCISYLFVPTTFAANSFTQKCISEAIPKILLKLRETPADKQELIYEEIRQNSFHQLFDTFVENLERCDIVSFSDKQYIMALNELQESQIITRIFPNVEERKRKILMRLFEYVESGSEAQSRNPVIIMQLEALLVFALTNCSVNFVLELLANSSTLWVNNSVEATISHGRHFFNTFRRPITEFLSRYQKDVVDNYVLPAVLTKEKLLIVIDCLKFFAESPKSIDFDELTEGIFTNWPSLSCWSPGDDCAQYLFYLIDAVAVQKETLEKLNTETKNPVFLWLLNYLLNEKRFLTGGKEYFKSLTPFISNANERNDLILQNKLKEFRDKYFEASSPTKLQDAECINMLKALLSLFCDSENIVVLKCVIMIGVSFAHEECDISIEQTLESIMRRISVEDQVKLINTVYELFNDVSQPAAFRLGCVQKFLVSLLYTSKEESLKIFFVDQMKNIIQILKRPIPSDSHQESNTENEIFVKTAAVSIAEVYVDLESDDIKLAVSLKCSDKESVKTIISKNLWNAVLAPVNLKEKSKESALRVLKCYCYNTLIKILLKVPKPEHCYTSVLSENVDRRRFIWQSIIDLNEEINLKMFIDEIPARQKALKQKRKELKTKSTSGTSMRSIPTQYLSTSSLVSSVKYDMSEWNISNEGYIMQTENKSYTIDLEEDKLNNHECMASLCELIRFIVESNVTPLPDPELNPHPELPKWMESLRHSLKYASDLGERRKNVVLFFLKMIHNCETIFCPYARGWIDLIIKCVLKLNEINYLTFDMIVMMITWCKVYIPTDKQKNNNLLALILRDIEKDETTVRNHRLELVRTFIRHWFEYVDVPYARLSSIYDRKEKSELLEVNLTLAKAFLLQGILPFEGADTSADELSRALMFHVDRKDTNRSLKILNFEVLALILECAKTKDVLTSCRGKLQEDLVTKLNSLRVDNTQTKTDLFFSCLEHTLICFPTILHRFIPYLECNFKKFQGKIKAQCLRIMTLDDNVPDDLFSQLMTMQFTNCLRDSNHEIVKNALIVIRKFVQTLKAEELVEILPDITRLSSHPTSECRQLVYEIADSVYKNYKNERREEFSPIKSQCKVILLNGLLDSDKVLQENIFKSWKERCNFSDQIVDRFVSIVKEMYSPENESRFVNYATDYLLDASSETPDYKSKIFDNPLSRNINFREQDFTPLSMFKNKHPIAPIFVNSLSNQLVSLSLYTSKMCTLVMPGSQQKLVFQPSQNIGSSSRGAGFSSTRQWSPDSNSPLQNYSLDEPELRKLRNRLQPNKRKASEFYAMRNVEKREQRIEILKTRTDRVEKDVQFSRTYRDGEFPDIEISRSAVINPLKILAKKDPVIARLVFISLFRGMLSDDVPKKDHLRAIGDGFNAILKHTLQHNNVLIETIFETVFFHSNEIQLDSQRIVISSHASGLLSLGALILENSLHSEMMLSANPKLGAKRMKIDDSVYRTKWVQLAELYKALDENDVVNGILKEKIEGHATESLKKGLAFEQIRDWKNARNVYASEIDLPLNSETQSFEEHFIFDAYLKCSANLSKWSEMKDMVTKKFQNLDDLWLDSWDTEHTLPWFFTAEAILGALHGDNNSHVQLNNIKRWSRDEVKSTILNNLITESMSILLFLNREHFEAKHKVKKSVESMLQNWNHSTASLNKFYKLLTLSEINTMLAPYSDAAQDGTLSVDACMRVVDMWESSPPRCDNLYWWDKRTAYRRLFCKKYSEKLDRERRGAIERLNTFKRQSCLQMFDVALQQQNEYVAENYFYDVKTMIANNETTDLEALKLNASKLYLMVAKKLGVASKYVECLKALDEYSWNEQLSYKYHVHMANTLRELQNDWNSFDFDTKARIIEFLRRLLDTPDIVADTVRIEMREAVGKHIGEAVAFAENNKLPPEDTAAAYLSWAKHSEELQIGNDESENLVHKENYIRCILRALKFDSREAQLLFPTLLQKEQITNETLKSVFMSEVKQIEEWKFLIWIQQLLAYIDTEKLPLIERLLLNVIEKYPNAIQFSLFSSDLVQYTYQNDAAKQLAQRLRETLNRNSAIEDFVKAVSCVRVPEGYFFHYMKKLAKALRRTDVAQIVSIGKEMFGDSARFKGKVFSESEWWEIFKTLLASIENQSLTAASQLSQVDGYVTKLREELAKTRSAQLRKDEEEYDFVWDYSGWFAQFSELELTNIEIPGQYDGFAPPSPERHVRIFEFDKHVQIQSSVQLPIKIRVTGDDAKKYSYLIKFGEDTRQDQRIQQIFSIMNRCGVADSEASGSGSNVSVVTYGVFPLTTYFGVIEWLERTTSLRDFMNYKRDSNFDLVDLRKEYDENIRRYDRNNQILAHEKAVKNFSKDVIVSTFERIRNQIPQDVFRKSILALCNSPIMYWNLRNQFVTSYSSLCVYGWILGIGDRHLGNFLVCLKTGRCVGIDFGHAFGTGTTNLEVPELIPFRMTPHIVDIMQPFGLTGLIRETMVNTLKIIHKNEYILLATMQIFILDPSFNWLKSIKRRRQELTGIEETEDACWYPALKIERIRRKLRGINPVKILEEELNENTIISANYIKGCIMLLNREDSWRSRLPSDNISLVEQIDSLLDIATDKCILGVSFGGLETYI